MLKSCCLCVSFVLLLVPLTGCGGPSPTKVSGKVMLNGQPVNGANVQFVPVSESGRSATGSTNAEGQFDMTTFENNDGALPGEYKVVIIYNPPVEGVTGNSTTTVMRDTMKVQAANAKKPKYVIPAEYTTSATTKLVQKVPADGPIVYDLK